MTPQDALRLIDGVIDSVTLVAKQGGNESGLTAGDRGTLKQAVALIREALEPKAE